VDTVLRQFGIFDSRRDKADTKVFALYSNKAQTIDNDKRTMKNEEKEVASAKITL
jgi:hypothetical protein